MYTHFTYNVQEVLRHKESAFHVFRLGVCENCEGPVQEPNSVTVFEPKKKLLRLGMKEMNGLPPETYYSERLGHSCCEFCMPEEDEEN